MERFTREVDDRELVLKTGDWKKAANKQEGVGRLGEGGNGSTSP